MTFSTVIDWQAVLTTVGAAARWVADVVGTAFGAALVAYFAIPPFRRFVDGRITHHFDKLLATHKHELTMLADSARPGGQRSRARVRPGVELLSWERTVSAGRHRAKSTSGISTLIQHAQPREESWGSWRLHWVGQGGLGPRDGVEEPAARRTPR